MVNVGAHRLAEIDAGFGAGDQEFDTVFRGRSQSIDYRFCGVNAETDRVFVRQAYGLLFHQQIVKTIDIQFAVLSEFPDIQKRRASKNIYRFNSNVNHGGSLVSLSARDFSRLLLLPTCERAAFHREVQPPERATRISVSPFTLR